MSGGPAGATGQPGSPASPASVGVRDALRNLGLDLGGRFQDDHGALQALAAAYQHTQQNQHLYQAGQEYVRHAEQFQAWRRQQEEAARAQQAQKDSWWKAPEYDPSWAQKLMRDPVTGEIKPIPGADPSILSKWSQAIEHRTQFLDKFAFDPMGSIKPGVEEVAKAIALQVVQEHLGTFQEQSFAGSWVQQNSQWLHAKDQQGNVARDPMTGQPQLSPAGQRFAGYVQALDQMGVRDVRQQQQLAQRLVEGDLARAQMGQQQQASGAVQQGEAEKQKFLQQAQAAAGQNYGTPAAQPQNQPKMKNSNDLQRAMMAQFGQAGIQPQDALIR